jgi:hypothetical protein
MWAAQRMQKTICGDFNYTTQEQAGFIFCNFTALEFTLVLVITKCVTYLFMVRIDRIRSNQCKHSYPYKIFNSYKRCTSCSISFLSMSLAIFSCTEKSALETIEK